MSGSEPSWDCEAYGQEAAAVGALCFVSGDLGKRVCADRDECHAVMAAARQRVFRRINELAARGHQEAAYLAGEFTNPGQLLGGGPEPADGEE